MFKKFNLAKKLMLGLAVVATVFSGCGSSDTDTKVEKEYKTGLHYVEMDISGYDPVFIELDANAAPITVTHFMDLVESGFYNGKYFYRFIKDFVLQGGDLNENDVPTVEGEFLFNGYPNTLSHTRGAISMARTNDYNSADCQFFFVLQDQKGLDGYYAAFGYVIAGMSTIDSICETLISDSDGAITNDFLPTIETLKVVDAATAYEAKNAETVYPDPVVVLTARECSEYIFNNYTKEHYVFDEDGDYYVFEASEPLLSFRAYPFDMEKAFYDEDAVIFNIEYDKGDLIGIKLKVSDSNLPKYVIVLDEHNGGTRSCALTNDGYGKLSLIEIMQ